MVGSVMVAARQPLWAVLAVCTAVGAVSANSSGRLIAEAEAFRASAQM